VPANSSSSSAASSSLRNEGDQGEEAIGIQPFESPPQPLIYRPLQVFGEVVFMTEPMRETAMGTFLLGQIPATVKAPLGSFSLQVIPYHRPEIGYLLPVSAEKPDGPPPFLVSHDYPF